MEVLVFAFGLLVTYGALLLKLWAFYDASTFTRAEYQQVDKMPRLAWLLALGAGIVLQFWLGAIQPDNPFSARSLTWAASILLVIVYYYDLRPKLKQARLLGPAQ